MSFSDVLRYEMENQISIIIIQLLDSLIIISIFFLLQSSLPVIPNVLKVYLENGQTRSFHYSQKTTVQVKSSKLSDVFSILSPTCPALSSFSLLLSDIRGRGGGTANSIYFGLLMELKIYLSFPCTPLNKILGPPLDIIVHDQIIIIPSRSIHRNVHQVTVSWLIALENNLHQHCATYQLFCFLFRKSSHLLDKRLV